MRSKVPLRYAIKMLGTPEFLRFSLGFALRKRLTARFDYNRADGVSKPMRQVNLKITNACNLRCKTCAQWGEAGYMIGQPTSVVRETVPLAAYQRMVDDIAPIKPWIYIWGGEPFLYPDLLPLLRTMKQRGLIGSVVTNGYFLAQHAEEIVDIGWDSLALSLDGTRELHDSIRGIDGTFDRLAKAIATVREVKKRRRSRKPHITLVTTVSKENADHLDEIVDLGEAMGADLMLLYYAWFTTEEIGRRHEEVLRRKLAITPKAWKGYLWSFDEIDPQAVVRSVKRIRSVKRSMPVFTIPDLRFEEIPRYYAEPAHLFGYDRCIYPWIVTEIMPNGDVATCRDFPDVVCGNMQEQSILEIFNNEKYRRFRKALKEEGTFPICARCCGLMGW
jgi:MoaA/NifB/PqqE/SkfB family radical SAM enzyme